MIDHVRGRLAGRGKDYVVVECAGLGLRTHVSAPTRKDLPPDGETCFLRTFLHLRDGACDLYGFSSETEREVFVGLTGVGGVGPRSALAVISTMGVPGILAACAREDAAAFTAVPGIGKKLAHRIAVELPDRLRKVAVELVAPMGADVAPPASTPEAEAAEALVALGFSRGEAEVAATRARREKGAESPPDVLVREALRTLSARRP